MELINKINSICPKCGIDGMCSKSQQTLSFSKNNINVGFDRKYKNKNRVLFTCNNPKCDFETYVYCGLDLYVSKKSELNTLSL